MRQRESFALSFLNKPGITLGRVDKIRNEQPKAIFEPEIQVSKRGNLPNCRAEDMDLGAKSAKGGDMSYFVHVAYYPRPSPELCTAP